MFLEKITEKEKGNFINRFNLHYKTRTNKEKIYEIVSRKSDITPKSLANNKPEAVMIIAFNEDMSKVCVNKEFRLSCNKEIYNMPAGLIDDDEDVVVAATRELKEETGLNLIETLDVLEGAYSAIGVSNERTSLVICKANGEFGGNFDELEEIEPIWIDKAQALEIAESGNCTARTQMFLYFWGSYMLNYR